MLSRISLVSLVAAGLVPACWAADQAETVKKLEAVYEQALVQRDMKTLDRLMTSDFIRTPPASSPTTKAEYLSQIETGRLQYVSHEIKESNYRVFGDTVLVHSVVRVRTRSNGKEGDSLLRLLHVWVKQDGQWRVAAVQGSRMLSR